MINQASVDPQHVKWNDKKQCGADMEVINKRKQVNWQCEHVELLNYHIKDFTTCQHTKPN